MLELKNIYKTFNPGTINEKRALNGLNLKLNEGDFAKNPMAFYHFVPLSFFMFL